MCSRADAELTVNELQRKNIGAAALRELLGCHESSSWGSWSGIVELTDEHGSVTEAAVHVPSSARRQRLGALVVLHGAGGNGEQVLPHLSPLGDRLSMAVVCPTAQMPSGKSDNMDLAGIFGKRFTEPRWDLTRPSFLGAALRWARTQLDVDPNRCALAGVSMGGLATWNLSMRFWHSLSAAIPINGALTMWEAFGPDRRTRSLLPNTLPLSMFVVHGGKDERIPPQFDRESVGALRNLGHPDIEYVEVPDGQHGFETLGMAAESPLFLRLERWLGSRRRTRQPSEIRHHANDDLHGRAHWIGMTGIEHQSVASLHARRSAGDRIDVEVRGASQVTLYLTSEWFTPGDTILVAINGVVSRVRFEPDLPTVVETFRSTADPDLVAEQVVSLVVPERSFDSASDTRAETGRAYSI